MILKDAIEAVKNNSLITLDISKIQLEDPEQDLRTIVKLLITNQSVVELRLCGEYITNDVIAIFCEGIRKNKSVAVLYIEGVQISIDTIHLLAGILEKNNSLRDLAIINCQLTDHAAVVLAKALKFSQNIKNVNLSKNQIGDKGAIELAEACRPGDYLATINLEQNNIGDVGAAVFANLLRSTGSLKYSSDAAFLVHLYLADNPISHSGVQMLAEALEDNYFIRALSLTLDENLPYENKFLEKINKKVEENQKFFANFLDLDKDFMKMGSVDKGSHENEVDVYLRKSDNSKWIVKANAGNEWGSRLGAIIEVYASHLMRLGLKDYPESMLLVSGGDFKVACPYIENLQKTLLRNQLLENVVMNFVMLYWIGDGDTYSNKGYIPKKDSAVLYKYDLGEAFYFHDKKIVSEVFTPQAIIKYLRLENIMDPKNIPSEEIIEVIKAFSELDSEQIKATGTIYRNMLEDQGEEILETLLNRKATIQNLLPVLEWKLASQKPQVDLAYIQKLAHFKMMDMKEDGNSANSDFMTEFKTVI